MAKKSTDPKKEALLPEDLIEERMQSMRDTHCPCPACQVHDPFHDMDAYRKRIETKIENERL